jgi:hypothetical protein
LFIPVRILICYQSRIPDPGVKKAMDPGSGFATLLSCCCFLFDVEWWCSGIMWRTVTLASSLLLKSWPLGSTLSIELYVSGDQKSRFESW